MLEQQSKYLQQNMRRHTTIDLRSVSSRLLVILKCLLQNLWKFVEVVVIVILGYLLFVVNTRLLFGIC